MKPEKSICLILIILTVSSCLSIKPATTKSGKHLWEEFYVSPEVNQYFIKPLTFSNSNNDDQFAVDFTFRNGSDSVTVNFSILSEKTIATPDQITFDNNNGSIKISNRHTLLKEKTNKKIKLRQTGKISFNEFTRLFAGNKWIVTTINDSASTTFNPANKTLKHIKSLNINLLDVIKPEV